MKKERLIVSIVILLSGMFMQFSTLMDSVPTWLGKVGIPITTLGIFLMIYSFEWKRKDNQYCEPLAPMEDEKKIELLRYDGLSSRKGKILRLFYRENGRERIVIFQRHDSFFSYAKEFLYLFDQSELDFENTYGYWMDVNYGPSLFQEEILVLRELEAELSEYREIEIPVHDGKDGE